MKIHHIGYLVKNLSEARDTFIQLGYKMISDIIYDKMRKVEICFLKFDEYMIELVSPLSPDSIVANLIKRYKNTPYHICYESDDFSNDIKKLISNGFIQIDEPAMAPAIDNKNVIFFLHSNIGLIEVLES